MVDRYIELKPYLTEITDEGVAEKMLPPREDLTLNLMNAKLKIYEFVCIWIKVRLTDLSFCLTYLDYLMYHPSLMLYIL